MRAPSSVASTAPETASKTKISPWMAGRPLVRLSGQTEIDLTAECLVRQSASPIKHHHLLGAKHGGVAYELILEHLQLKLIEFLQVVDAKEYLLVSSS